MERAAPRSPIGPCSRWGFPCLLNCSRSGGLLPRLFTLTTDTQFTVAVCSLWHYPSKSPCGLSSRVYLTRTSMSYAASRPMELGLSSPDLRPERFSALPESAATYPTVRRRQASKWVKTPVGMENAEYYGYGPKFTNGKLAGWSNLERKRVTSCWLAHGNTHVGRPAFLGSCARSPRGVACPGAAPSAKERRSPDLRDFSVTIRT